MNNRKAARRSRRLARALIGVVAIAALSAPLAAGGIPEERQRAIDRFVGQFTELAMFDGTVLIDVGGEVVYRRSFGRAHHELDVPHGERTRFHIASVSKMLTDAAIAVLIQRGILTLDTPIARFLPDFPAADKITAGRLLDSTSGIPHTNDQPWGDAKTTLTLDEIVARLAALPLDFEPGTDRSYSNGAYAVAAKVIELAGGGSFAEVMEKLVFAPLEMRDTGHISDVRVPIPGKATGYEPGLFPGERRHPRFYAVETRPGGGSLYSTVPDLHRFARALFREGFLEERLLRDVLGADDGPFLSQGRSPGFVARLLYDPGPDLIVVSLSNNYAVPADWARALVDLATGNPEATAWPELRPVAPTVAGDDPRLGRYRNSFGGGELTIERGPRGVLLLVDRENESTTALVPLADGAFLQPLYFQRCVQDAATRVITCGTLSGDERYTSVLTPLR